MLRTSETRNASTHAHQSRARESAAPSRTQDEAMSTLQPRTHLNIAHGNANQSIEKKMDNPVTTTSKKERPERTGNGVEALPCLKVDGARRAANTQEP